MIQELGIDHELLSSTRRRSILSYIILFEFDTSIEMENAEKLEDLSIVNSALIDEVIVKNHATFCLQTFVSTLEKMSLFCSKFIQLESLKGFKWKKFYTVKAGYCNHFWPKNFNHIKWVITLKDKACK